MEIVYRNIIEKETTDSSEAPSELESALFLDIHL